jgi:hypothetical protein
VTSTGAGLKIKTRCKQHVFLWESAEFFNQVTILLVSNKLPDQVNKDLKLIAKVDVCGTISY